MPSTCCLWMCTLTWKGLWQSGTKKARYTWVTPGHFVVVPYHPILQPSFLGITFLLQIVLKLLLGESKQHHFGQMVYHCLPQHTENCHPDFGKMPGSMLVQKVQEEAMRSPI
jgi:hypothetical protein